MQYFFTNVKPRNLQVKFVLGIIVIFSGTDG